jgi:hypothetical protein
LGHFFLFFAQGISQNIFKYFQNIFVFILHILAFNGDEADDATAFTLPNASFQAD